MGNDGLPISIVVLVSVIFVVSVALAGLIVYVLLNAMANMPAA